MTSTPLILAALATSAVANLNAVAARKHTLNEDGECTSVVVTTDHNEVIVRVPMNDTANAELSAAILGQNALTGGARAQLPFAVPEVLGVTRSGDSRAVVSTFISGAKFAVGDLSPDALLVASIAACLDALHSLPGHLVSDAGLPVNNNEQCRANALRLVERASASGLLPVAIREYWLGIIREQALWDFAATPIHGSLDASQFLVHDNAVTGILGFGSLQVGDPARDFAWLYGAPAGVLEEVVRRYSERTDMAQESLARRALLYHELELAKWLLHGIETHNQEIIDDAVELLDGLVEKVTTSTVAPVRRVTNEQLAKDVISSTPAVAASTGSATDDLAALDGLDDDRVFNQDTDFIEPLPEELTPAQQSEEQESSEQNQA
ncbi:phosphotransferase [Canibacter zhoujuaniae]|uniref:phosphotransferase n=1 Tax=Canibacter zhoujuaniae TaxID=2708343 RepID=UPI00141D9B46|nr:phosphotransferase [Canibacter zhoujuaniae]